MKLNATDMMASQEARWGVHIATYLKVYDVANTTTRWGAEAATYSRSYWATDSKTYGPTYKTIRAFMKAQS